MRLIPFSLEFYEDLVDMHHKFVMEVFGDKRRISPKYFFYKEVQKWIQEGHEIVLVVNDSEVAGYTMSYIDDYNGLTEPVYNGEIAYVKPEYRKTRAGYLLYNNVSQRAKDLNLNIMANGRVENMVDKMIEKHFSAEKTFITFERTK